MLKGTKILYERLLSLHKQKTLPSKVNEILKNKL